MKRKALNVEETEFSNVPRLLKQCGKKSKEKQTLYQQSSELNEETLRYDVASMSQICGWPLANTNSKRYRCDSLVCVRIYAYIQNLRYI